MITIPNIPDLPNLYLTEIESLPECSAIYFVISSSGEILYIGKSININVRWRGHHRLEQFSKMDNVRIAWMEVLEKNLLLQIEEALIEFFLPAFNGGPVPKPPRSPIVTEREKTIGVRVSPKEYEAIQRRADKLGLRVASYVRLLALQDAEEELQTKN